MRRLILRIAAAVLVWPAAAQAHGPVAASVAAMPPAAELVAPDKTDPAAARMAERLEPYFESLATCQIEHLTWSGYLAIADSEYLVRTWRPDDLDRFAVAAARRDGRTGLRAARFLQLVHGSSFQAADAYARLAAWMRETGVDALERPDVEAAARLVFQRRLAAEGLAGCAMLKWGNRRPDLFAQPLPQETWQAIARLFREPERVDFPLTEVEAQSIASGELTRPELLELRALRLAITIFERQYALMRHDEGGWIGNALDLSFVCTDEATTISFFVTRLRRAGLLTRFDQLAARFAHRGGEGLLPNDHYAPMLRNLRTERFFVIDTWLEDGGVPPYVDVLDRWLSWAERRPFASIGDPELDRALAKGLVEREDEAWMARLDAHMARFEPEVATLPDGRPDICGTSEFFFCGRPPPPAWGRATAAIDPGAG